MKRDEILTKSEAKKYLAKAEKIGEKDKLREGRYLLALTVNKFGFKAIGREIINGRNVRGNARMAVNMAHDRFGPKYDLESKKFIPQTDKMKELEKSFIGLVNAALYKSGEVPLVSSELLKNFKEKDKAFEERVKGRK
jgi:hypothetical protein